MLQILYNAKAAGLVSEKLVNTIADWLSEVEHEYRFYAEQVDPWYKRLREERDGERPHCHMAETWLEQQAKKVESEGQPQTKQ